MNSDVDRSCTIPTKLPHTRLESVSFRHGIRRPQNDLSGDTTSPAQFQVALVGNVQFFLSPDQWKSCGANHWKESFPSSVALPLRILQEQPPRKTSERPAEIPTTMQQRFSALRLCEKTCRDVELLRRPTDH